VNVHVFGQSGAGASAEVHTNVEAVRLYGQGQRFLCFSNELGHLQQFGVLGLFEVGYVPNRSD
jgi:hypothetical protein